MKYMIRFFILVIIMLLSNILILPLSWKGVIFLILILLFIFINIFPSLVNLTLLTTRLRICADGCELLIVFICSLFINGIILLYLWDKIEWYLWIMNLCIVILIECILFWNGIIRVYVTSIQIAMRWRVIGIVCGWIPIINLWVLSKIICIASLETQFENDKLLVNKNREKDVICKTKYPILLVHGVFFRDYKYFNYWGRIPQQLEENGATIYYGNHESAASIAASAHELSKGIKQICKEEQCEKVNIIAHSKGGLDSRYAISKCGMKDYVATLTTINTPHRGCVFADYLLDKLSDKLIQKTADGYNFTLKKLGDTNPDFIASIYDLRASSCEKFNEIIIDEHEVFYQSVGSKLDHVCDSRFPLNFTMQLVKYFDGPNDGLVAQTSFPWGENFILLTTDGKRGISHGDMIDLNRENIKDFDVREFYVTLVSDLKKKGY